MRQGALVLDDLCEVATVDPTTAGRTADEMLSRVFGRTTDAPADVFTAHLCDGCYVAGGDTVRWPVCKCFPATLLLAFWLWMNFAALSIVSRQDWVLPSIEFSPLAVLAHLQSSSASLRTASHAGFFILSQSGERVHKTANLLNNAKADLREIYGAPTRAAAEAAIDVFADKYGAKYDKTVACPTKDREALTERRGRFDLPSQGKHVRLQVAIIVDRQCDNLSTAPSWLVKFEIVASARA
jgi:hypothetical protein